MWSYQSNGQHSFLYIMPLPYCNKWNTRIILSVPLRFVYGYNWCLQPMQEESNDAKSNSYSNSNRKSLIAHWVTASGAVVWSWGYGFEPQWFGTKGP